MIILFVPQNVSDLALVLAPSEACFCLAWLSVWASLPLDTPASLVPFSSVRHKSAGSV